MPDIDNDRTRPCIQEFYDYLSGNRPLPSQIFVLSGWTVLKAFIIAFGIAIISFGILMVVPLPNDDYAIFYFLFIVGGMPLLGIGLGLYIMHRATKNNTRTGCRGILVANIGGAFQFLDMIVHGQVDLGDINKSQTVDDYDENELNLRVLNLANRLQVIKKIAPNEYGYWWSLLRGQLMTVTRFREKLLIVFLIGTLLLAVGFQILMIVATILQMKIDVLIIILVILAILGMLSVTVILAVSILKDKEDSTRKAMMVVDTPEIRNATERVIDEFLETLHQELKCPVRCYIIGQYPQIYRSGVKIYTTTGAILYESFILPSEVRLDIGKTSIY